MYDIYGHWHIPFWQTQNFKIILCILIAVCAIALGWIIIKLFFKARILNPEQRALQALNKLMTKEITTRYDAYQAYHTISDILKKFFQETYNDSFMHMTDNEMIINLKKYSFPNDLREPLQQLLNASEGVKYAQEYALQEALQQHINFSMSLVKRISLLRDAAQ